MRGECIYQMHKIIIGCMVLCCIESCRISFKPTNVNLRIEHCSAYIDESCKILEV